MQAGHPSVRSTLALAVIVMFAVIGFRISGPVAGLLDAYKVHISLTTHSTSPVPPKHVAPVVRYIVIPPKLYRQP